MIKNIAVAAFILMFYSGIAQDTEETIWVWETFKDTRIINGHSVETGMKGEGKFIISHRFGKINGGGYELFGLDQSSIRFGLDYAINGKFDVGIGRSSFGKTYDGYFKYRVSKQREGAENFPISVAYMSSTALNTLKWLDPDRKNFSTSKLTYTHQLLLARKFSPGFSLQIMPTLVHRNLVGTALERHDVLSLGAGGRVQLTYVIALQFEYYYVLPNQLLDKYKNSLSFGFEFQTKAHVFQIHFSNSTGMIAPIYITETVDSWSDFSIRLGFNLTRDFKLGTRNFKE